MTTRIPWHIDLLPDLAGVGCLALAVIGLVASAQRRQPAAVAAAAVLVSLIGSSYFIRAIREPRHWIAAVPALLLLNLAAYAWLHSRWPRAAPAAARRRCVDFRSRSTGNNRKGFASWPANFGCRHVCWFPPQWDGAKDRGSPPLPLVRSGRRVPLPEPRN